jgi:hypothetical protein
MEASGGGPRIVANYQLDRTVADMLHGLHLRKWAAQVARQAGEEPDPDEAQRWLSIAEYWVRLADSEEFNQPVQSD